MLYYKSVRLPSDTFFMKSQKDLDMQTHDTKSLTDLAHEAAIKAIPTPSETKDDKAPCADKDKECLNRWISSLSDCA